MKFRYIMDLSFQIAKADFKLKNEGSYLGIFWYLLNPILTFTILFFIFSDRLGDNIPLYPLYLLIGILLFNFFQSTTLESTRTLILDNHHLIKSINFPKTSLILAIVLKNLLSHFFEILLFCLIMIFLGTNTSLILWYIPILIFFSLFTFGVSLILSSLTVFFVDLDNIWNFTVRLLWLGTPIFYTIEGQMKLFYVNIFNPLYYFITAMRDVIIYHSIPELWIIWGVVGFSLASVLTGIIIFGRLHNKIAELI